ncbi:MAG: ABC transporter ATP-binding protein [Chloroflexi bacterium]|nr:ABC transporter ATP-binding protein [Chloroflexota bacterium]
MAQHSEVVIQTKNLTKKYGGMVALHDLNLEVQRGEVFGYLGPNGAGKTTTIRTLLDLIRPTSGAATILGLDSRRDSVKIHAQVGFLPSEMTLYHNMTGRQYVQFIEQGRRVACMAEAERLAQRLDYDLHRSLEGLSTGNRRKMGLIAALMHRPPLLILDEPTSGLDPLMQQTFNELIREIQAEGRTVFLSSHNLPEVEALCDRVGILRAGKLVTVETIQALANLRFRWFILEFEQPVEVSQFKALSNVTALEANSDNTRLRIQVSGTIDSVIKLAAHYPLHDLSVEHPSLEEAFLEFYGSNNGKGVQA